MNTDTGNDTNKNIHTEYKLTKKQLVIAGGLLVLLLALIIGIGIYNTPTNRLTRQLDLGNHYLEEQDYGQAVIEFDKAIALDPMSVDAYLGKARAYEGMGDIDMAMQTLKTGYELIGDERFLEAMQKLEAMQMFDLGTIDDSSHDQEYTDRETELYAKVKIDSIMGSAMGSCIGFFETEFIDKGDHYEATGKIIDYAHISADMVENMSAGDCYSYDGIDFFYQQKGVEEDGEHVYYTFTDGYENEYVVSTRTSVGMDGITYYYIQDVRGYNTMGEPSSPGGNFYILIEDNYVFSISKQQQIVICTNQEDGKYDNELFTFEQIIENDICDYNGNSFSHAIGIPIELLVDSEGKIIDYSIGSELTGMYIDTSGRIRDIGEIMTGRAE